MSSTSPPELTASNIGRDRIYSSATDDSPFGSSLVTPTDEEVYGNAGIHERLDAAETILGYFGSKEIVSEETEKKTRTLNDDIEEVVGVVEKNHQGVGGINEGAGSKEQHMSPILSSLDSSKSLDSPMLSSTSSESIKRPITTGLYSLPNEHIVVESGSNNAQKDEVRPLIDSDSIPIIKRPDLGTGFWLKELAPTLNSLTLRALIFVAFRLICFLPWCIAVGGALILSPEHLEFIAFRTGYLEALSGIRRYSHFAEYGFQHVVAFLTFLGIMTWMAPTVGLLCIGGLLAQFCWAWHTFLVDRNIPLGDDDRQTVYLLATTTWLNDTTVNIRKIDGSYYAAGTPRKMNTVSTGDSKKIST